MESGDIEDARLILQNILHRMPSHLSARVLLARIYESDNDHESALIMWKQAAYHGPGNAVIETGLRDSILRKQFGDAKIESPVGEPSRPQSKWAPIAEHTPVDDAPESAAPERAAPGSAAPEAATPEPESENAANEPESVNTAPEPELEHVDTAGPDGGEVPEFQDLDQLIEELETAAIVPNPDIPMVSDEELEQDLEDVVSETLARIYANQSYYEEASVVYEKLSVQQPDRADEFLQKAREMKEKSS